MTKNTQDFGFPKRLHFSWEYRRFFVGSDVFRLSECTVFRIPNQLEHFRLGITFKARGRSVDRNAVKRQIRESFRTLGASLGSYDYNVVVPKYKKLPHPYAERLGHSLRGHLLHVLSKK